MIAVPKLQLVLSDIPKRILCPTRESVPVKYSIPDFIRFPCYIEDFGTYWQIRVDGSVMYLTNIDGIVLYKNVFANPMQYGLGTVALGGIDSLKLNSIDALSFRDITLKAANWLALTCSTAHFVKFEKLGDYDPYSLGKMDSYMLPGRV